MSDELLKSLKNKRKQVKSALTRFSTYLDNIKDKVIIEQVEDRHAKIKNLFNEFEEVQSQIEQLDEAEFELDTRAVFEDSYFNAQHRARILFKEYKSTHQDNNTKCDSADTNQLNNFVKLPTINLPVFSGAYEEWLSFHDTFNSIIHANTSMPSVQKFHYLKSCLKGEASNVLHSLEISGDNYLNAWDMLNERYNNKRVIVQKHLKAIFSLPTAHKENYGIIRQILDGVLKHVRALGSLKRPTEHWDDLLVYIIANKLDSITIKEWEASITSKELPSFKQITDFLARKCQTLETTLRPSGFKGPERVSTNVVTSGISCPICKENHFIYFCKTFLNLTIHERIQQAKAKNLCANCLRAGHSIQKCKGRSCKVCNKRHNSLLHLSPQKDPNPVASTSQATVTDTVISNHSVNTVNMSHILLSTAVVNLVDSKGHIHTCRALLDSGSQSNLITTKMANMLNLPLENANISISGISPSKTRVSHSIQINLRSRTSGFQANADFLILNKISEAIPLVSFARDQIVIPQNIILADPQFNISREIDILLGVELFYKLLCVGQINLGKNQPCLQKTLLGWIISGRTNSSQIHPDKSICNFSTLETLNNNISRFWEIENIIGNAKHSPEDRLCEGHFSNTIRRSSDGRLIVSLPFKKESSLLGHSREQALRRFYSLERKLNKNPALKKEYSTFIDEYLELGHMRAVCDKERNISCNKEFYLPHHCVIKESSSTTRLRVVFDGSAKSSTGISLNDILLVGPKLQQDLFDIVCRFRSYKYVLTADVTKMYRQVLMSDECIPLQRILWRNHQNEKVRTYELLTVTYGTASASYLAIKALQHLAIENRNTYRTGANVVLNDFYVDDLLTGANDISELIKIKGEVTDILKQGKFELRKWASNEPAIFNNLRDSSNHAVLDIDKNESISTLGLQWHALDDTLQYSIALTSSRAVTKRAILSHISKIFDPLGILGPVIINAKLLMQLIWSLKADWDESLPLHIQESWQNYIKEMSVLKNHRVPRCVIDIDSPHTHELHGFCDASERAYGACIYIRAVNELGHVSCNLLCSKSRVAPIKATTLPRLELCGALLLAQLVRRLKSTMSIKFQNIYLWTDSNIVLSWISSQSKTWKTFVANRVAEIQDITDSSDWRHINTAENPADMLSRGTLPSHLINTALWWNGPSWLRLEAKYWPQPNVGEFPNDLSEKRKVVVAVVLQSSVPGLFYRYSALNRLLRIVAHCRRFINNMRSRVSNNSYKSNTGPLSASELNDSMLALLKIAQAFAFEKDIAQIQKNGKLNSTSTIISLNPFIHADGLLRVGGRLKYASVPYDQKHQILLPSKHPLTELIIKDVHVNHLHAGTQLTIAAVRSKYWPISVKNSVKSLIKRCVTCFKANPSTIEHLMGDLPANRVQTSRPFQNVGVDYFGPLQVTEGRRKNSKTTKVYGAVFVCFATKAIHIELAGSLSTDSFLAALRRFISRRGKMSNIYSDNGTQFIGANKEIKSLMQQFLSQASQQKIHNTLAEEGISWHFIPPRSPHFGGLWESAVKSIKYHLRRVIGKTSLNYEEMNTLLIQIEGVLNSRPITPISNDPNDFSFLTPSHFLIGDAVSTMVEPSLAHLRLNTLSRWQYIQQVREHFWKRWSREYLNQLQIRNKWKDSKGKQIRIGDLVLIKEDNTPPSSWITGRVQEVFPGSDGVIRVAAIKTARGIYQRAISKLSVFPVDSEWEQ